MNHKLEQFLSNDRKVLRFYAYWDDPTRYGARQYFVMHYYLADDSVEINNNYMRNSGRWECPVFFTRKKLELQPTMTHTPGMYKPESPLLKPSDIEVGKSIPVYGREFFLYDADDATKEFYEKYLDKIIEPVVVPEPEKVHLQLLYPPHNGFGGDEDSLGSCLQLRPKPPRKDLVKMMTNDAYPALRGDPSEQRAGGYAPQVYRRSLFVGRHDFCRRGQAAQQRMLGGEVPQAWVDREPVHGRQLHPG